MEQQLILELLNLICKGGGELMVKDLIQETHDKNSIRKWTEGELENAITYLHNINTAFGPNDAKSMIKVLIKQYNIQPEDLHIDVSDLQPEELAAREEL